MIRTYTESSRAQHWMQAVIGQRPLFACVLGFTETGLIPGISAAGATPRDRQYTAIADAEFLYNGPSPHPAHPLPPLQAGASPVFISRAVTEGLSIPVQIVNAGLPQRPTIPCMDLNGHPAQCITTGQAMDVDTVHRLVEAGLELGTHLGKEYRDSYLIFGECVVGGTTTALAVLTALGWPVDGMVNSSHPTCNHVQKQQVVAQGLYHVRTRHVRTHQLGSLTLNSGDRCRLSQNVRFDNDPIQILSAVGDPMQAAVAGMAMAASRSCRVMLAGGTQMLAVYALAIALATSYAIGWTPEHIIVGTTRWVADDPTGDTRGLAQLLQCPLIATQLSLASSRYPALRAYERGFVKEGVGAGGCAIAAHLYQQWGQVELLRAIEAIATAYEATSLKTPLL